MKKEVWLIEVIRFCDKKTKNNVMVGLCLSTILCLGLLMSTVSDASDMSVTYENCVRGSHDQQQFMQCLKEEIMQQDRRLNKNYRLAMHEIASDRKADLRKVQRIWIKYKSAKCSLYHHATSGSGGVMDELECLLRETVRRADELHE